MITERIIRAPKMAAPGMEARCARPEELHEVEIFPPVSEDFNLCPLAIIVKGCNYFPRLKKSSDVETKLRRMKEKRAAALARSAHRSFQFEKRRQLRSARKEELRQLELARERARLERIHTTELCKRLFEENVPLDEIARHFGLLVQVVAKMVKA